MAKTTNWTSIAYLLIGTNLGDRQRNLKAAIGHLADIGEIVACSGIYQTAAWGITDQPEFLNQALALKTAFTPLQLLEALKQIEQQMGRSPGRKWGERLIDIDILFMGDLQYENPSLNVPHPQVRSRRFALVPLKEIAPDLVDPITGKTISELLNACADPLTVDRLP